MSGDDMRTDDITTNDDDNQTQLVDETEIDQNEPLEARESRNDGILKPLYSAIKPIEMVKHGFVLLLRVRCCL